MEKRADSGVGRGADITAVGGSAGAAFISDIDVTAVGGRAAGGASVAVSSDVGLVKLCSHGTTPRLHWLLQAGRKVSLGSTRSGSCTAGS